MVSSGQNELENCTIVRFVGSLVEFIAPGWCYIKIVRFYLFDLVLISIVFLHFLNQVTGVFSVVNREYSENIIHVFIRLCFSD